MATQRQIEANRCNAQRSTGPRTKGGKRRSAMNALRHGLSARTARLPEEDRHAYASFVGLLRRALKPVGAAELDACALMVDAAWRLRALARRRARAGLPPEGEASAVEELTRLDRYEVKLDNQFHRAFDQLRRLQRRRAAFGPADG